MQLTQHTDFGLRLLIVLAREGGPLALPAFSAQQGLSYHHVAKVAQALVAAGFAVSHRGRSGGIALARPAPQISVGDVVRTLEKGMRLADCATCALRADCALSGVLAEALEAFLGVLDRYTLADVAREGVAAFAPWAALPPAPACAVSEAS
jgi:Rrf2 family nitric oxide-sensitive transcriptional repressor